MSSPKKTVLILLGMAVAAIVGVSAVFAVFIELAETEFVPGEEVYLRDVYVIIDQTLSMQQGQRKEAKEILEEEIIHSMGLGDRISCYRIASNFTETNDRVFTSTRYLPRIYNNVSGVSTEIFSDNLKSELLRRWNLFASERQGWLHNLNNIDHPRGIYSDYLGTLEEIGRRIGANNQQGQSQETWLVVIGDLKHEPVLRQPPAPQNGEKRQFADVNIFMIYPGGIHNKQEQIRIENFWKAYFAARGSREVNYISFDGFIGRFPANNVPAPGKLGLAIK